jgi:hypothetical protein
MNDIDREQRGKIMLLPPDRQVPHNNMNSPQSPMVRKGAPNLAFSAYFGGSSAKSGERILGRQATRVADSSTKPIVLSYCLIRIN